MKKDWGKIADKGEMRAKVVTSARAEREGYPPLQPGRNYYVLMLPDGERGVEYPVQFEDLPQIAEWAREVAPYSLVVFALPPENAKQLMLELRELIASEATLQ